ncbi:MAG: DUF4252 domain-containing protein [Muribaculaceae bacterium]|jgi:hypothetical protein|nr:DUF4252 domain-containing protein [Muribaculaceae bacterium]MBQ2398491.1 DUF4252 domain-containing protein [Muribaculaceae bacterium]MBQ5724030.1 DUF4252 domain-containing protein [Muribaculaceae bacterium]
MKKHILTLIFAALFCVSNAYATKEFEDLAEIEGVDYIYISKAMLKNVSEVSILDGFDLGHITSSLSSLEILECDLCDTQKDLNKIRKTITKFASNMELLTKTKEEGTTVYIYSRSDKGNMTDLLIVEDEETEVYVIYIKGDIDEKAIKGLSIF